MKYYLVYVKDENYENILGAFSGGILASEAIEIPEECIRNIDSYIQDRFEVEKGLFFVCNIFENSSNTKIDKQDILKVKRISTGIWYKNPESIVYKDTKEIRNKEQLNRWIYYNRKRFIDYAASKILLHKNIKRDYFLSNDLILNELYGNQIIGSLIPKEKESSFDLDVLESKSKNLRRSYKEEAEMELLRGIWTDCYEARTHLYITQEFMNHLQSSQKIKINYDTIPIEYLKKILRSSLYFDYAYRYFSKEIDKFITVTRYKNDKYGFLSYKKSSIIKALETLIENSQINLSIKEKERYEILKSFVSSDRFFEKYKNQKFDIETDDIIYSIDVENIISLFSLDDKEFYDIFSNDDIKYLNGIAKENFIFSAYSFLKNNKILSEYNLPDVIFRHYQAIDTLFSTCDLEYEDYNKEISRDSKLGKMLILEKQKNYNNIPNLFRSLFENVKVDIK